MLITSHSDLSSISSCLIGVAHTESYSVFGNAGLSNFLKKYSIDELSPIYGHFILVKKCSNFVSLQTDFFGLCRLFLYNSGSTWAISESQEELVKFAIDIGSSLSPYLPAAYALHLGQGLGHQLTSFRTLFEEITLLPHWLSVEIRLSRISFKVREEPNWDPDLARSITRAKAFFSSLINAYQSAGLKPTILLSAGIDSRCTAALISSSQSKDAVSKIFSYTMKSIPFSYERTIAEELSLKFGFSKLDFSPSRREPSWPQWRRAYLGSFSHFASFPRFNLPSAIFGGGGSANIKPFYNWNGSIDELPFTDKVPQEARASIRNDIKQVIADFTSDVSESLSVEVKHYTSLRNRFHFGKDVRDSIFNFPPLAYSMINAGKKSRGFTPFHKLLYQSASLDICSHQFDSDLKPFPANQFHNWKSHSDDNINIVSRELFIGDSYSYDFENLSGSEPNKNKHPHAINSLLTDEFYSDCKNALCFVKREKLLANQMISSANAQLHMIEEDPANKFPGLFPDLMAVLTLGMLNNHDNQFSTGVGQIDNKPFALKGREGHLFLGGDSNNSIAQFTESNLLSEGSKASWDQLFNCMPIWLQKNDLKDILLLIAPSKEEIFPEYYPFKRAQKTITDDFMGAFKAKSYIYPKWDLMSKRDYTYSRTDTHWTDYGATVAASSILKVWGLPVDTLPSSYCVKKRIGDLGNKLKPMIASYDLVFTNSTSFCKVFDNGVTNQGCIRCYTNDNASISECLLIFGDSFGVNLAEALASTFRQVVFCYQPAGFDQEIVELFKPVYVLLQINQRFLHGQPATNSSISAKAAIKILGMHESKREKLISGLNQTLDPYRNVALLILSKYSHLIGNV